MTSLPTSWQIVPLKFLVQEAQSGFASGKRDANGTVQVRMNNVTTEGSWDWSRVLRVPASEKQCSKYRLEAGDVLVNTTNSPNLVGKAVYFSGSHETLVFSNHFVRLRLKHDRIDSNYLRRWLNLLWNRRVFEGLCTQWVNQASVRKEDLLAVHVPLPSLEEQRRIAAILDKADAVRRKRQQAIALTEELLRSAFLEMFGDPVTNPKGWAIDVLENFGQIITGNTPPRANLENYGNLIEWIKSDNITTPNHFLTEAAEKLSYHGKNISRIVPAGSVLVVCIAGSRSSIGRVALADREVSFNQQINAVVPNPNVDPYFLYSQFFIAQSLVQSQSTDSMKGLVSKSKFSSIQFIRPPEQKQREFGNWFLSFHKWFLNLHKDIQLSNNLFKSLLQKAFGGEI